MLATLGVACSLLPEQRGQPRAEQMERAVLPMARAALNAGQTETARRLYRRLLQIDPGSVDARMGLGDAAVESREPAVAAQWYLAALANARSPEAHDAALLAHGRAALSAGQLEPARKSFARLTDPLAETSQANVAWGYNGLGLTLLLAGDLRGATAAMEQAVLRAPDEPRFRGNLARALAMLTELESGAPGATRDDALASLEAELLPLPAPSVHAADSSPVPGEPSSAALPDNGPEERASRSDVVSTTAPVPRAAERPPTPSPDAPEDADEGGEEPDATLRTVLEEVAEPPEPRHEDAPSVAEPSTPPVTAARQSAVAGAAPADSPESSAEPPHEDPPTATPEFNVAPTPAPEASAESVDGKAEQTSVEPAARAPSRAATRSPSPNGPTADDNSAATRPRVLREDGWTFVQAASYASPASARALAARLREASEHPIWVSEAQDVDGRTWFRVRIGPVPSEVALAELAAVLQDRGFGPLAFPVGDQPGQVAAAAPPLVLNEDGVRFVQTGAYANRATAEEVAGRLRALTDRPVELSPTRGPDDVSLFRVRIGPVPSHEALVELRDALTLGGYDAMDLPAPEEEPPVESSATPGPLAPPPLLLHEGGERYLQAGAYSARSAAESLAARLQDLGVEPVLVTQTVWNGKPIYRVRIGPVEPGRPMDDWLDAIDTAHRQLQ